MAASTAHRLPPAERLAQIPSIARQTREGTIVLVVCRSMGVVKQYRRLVKSAGGRPKNLRFAVCPRMFSTEPE